MAKAHSDPHTVIDAFISQPQYSSVPNSSKFKSVRTVATVSGIPLYMPLDYVPRRESSSRGYSEAPHGRAWVLGRYFTAEFSPTCASSLPPLRTYVVVLYPQPAPCSTGPGGQDLADPKAIFAPIGANKGIFRTTWPMVWDLRPHRAGGAWLIPTQTWSWGHGPTAGISTAFSRSSATQTTRFQAPPFRAPAPALVRLHCTDTTATSFATTNTSCRDIRGRDQSGAVWDPGGLRHLLSRLKTSPRPRCSWAA
jgi:hypothetical protein